MSMPESPSPAQRAPRPDHVVDFVAARTARRDAQRRAEIATRGFLWINGGQVLPARGAPGAATSTARPTRVALDLLRD